MKQPKKPLWRKSMLAGINLYSIGSELCDIADNGDCYGYEREGESEYYYEYKELFDEIAVGASVLYNAGQGLDSDVFDAFCVGLLQPQYQTLGYDTAEEDYYDIDEIVQRWAQEEAVKKLMRMTKSDLIHEFGKVLFLVAKYSDIKCAHDCLAAIVGELDSRAAIFKRNVESSFGGDDMESIFACLPDRAWIE